MGILVIIRRTISTMGTHICPVLSLVIIRRIISTTRAHACPELPCVNRMMIQSSASYTVAIQDVRTPEHLEISININDVVIEHEYNFGSCIHIG